MSGKLAIGGLVAVAAMALSAGTASAQYIVRHGNHYHTVSPAYGHGGGFYQPVYTTPIYTTPVYSAPFYQPAYTTPIYPSVYGGGLGYGGGYYNRPVYGGGYGGGFGTVNVGVHRPGFGLNLGFVIR